MTTRMTRLLQQGVPEPERLLDPDTVMSAARRRRTWQRATATTASVLVVTSAVSVPLALVRHHNAERTAASPRRPATTAQPTSASALASGTASPSPTQSTGALQPSACPEGPRIVWDARLNNSIVVTAEKLAQVTGLAFTPVIPAFGVAPSRIDVSTDPSQGARGGLVELHYTFGSSPAFPDDSRVIVREQPVALAPAGLADLATGRVPPHLGEAVDIAGHLSVVVQTQDPTDCHSTFEVVTVRGKALMTIAGPAVSRAEVIRLAGKF